MKRYMTAASLLFLVVAISHVRGFQEQSVPDEPEVTYLINLRAIEGEERRYYVAILEAIESISRVNSVDVVVPETVRLAKTIDDLPSVVHEETRYSLRRELGKAFWEATRPKLPPTRALLLSPEPSAHLIATYALNYSVDDEILPDPDLIEVLVNLATSTEIDSGLRSEILGTFFMSGTFEEVRPIAEQLAAQVDDPDLARDAAFYLCAALFDEEFRYGYVVDHFHGDNVIVKQEAALALARFATDEMPQQLTEAVVHQLLTMATDTSLSPITRGEAIEELEPWVDRESVTATLLDLLDPERWFFGATGNHGPVHSLVPLIWTLQRSDRLSTLEAAMRVEHGLDQLPEGNRNEVESVLRLLRRKVDEHRE